MHLVEQIEVLGDELAKLAADLNDIHQEYVQYIHHKEADENIHDFSAYHFDAPLLIV